jgi:hypothetical protein
MMNDTFFIRHQLLVPSRLVNVLSHTALNYMNSDDSDAHNTEAQKHLQRCTKVEPPYCILFDDGVLMTDTQFSL